VLDANTSIGGTWSEERIYEGLVTNNQVGSLEFSDFPMGEEFGVKEGDHVPGMVMHRYLTAYAKKFGVLERCRFGCWVRSAEMVWERTKGVEEEWEGSYRWIVRYGVKDANGDGEGEVIVRGKKLVMATGSTSAPNIPILEGSEEFQGEIFHSKDLSLKVQVEAIDKAQNIVVLGGAKSAADAVYLNASKGRHVDWVIRCKLHYPTPLFPRKKRALIIITREASGRGPSWLVHTHISTFKLAFDELSTTRLMTLLVPVFDSKSRIRRLLHGTPLGRALIRGILKLINKQNIAEGHFNSHPETWKLIPKHGIEWYGTSVGAFNHPTDLFELIREGKVHVHLADITSLSSKTVHLSNGTDINTDILICATGWKQGPTIKILPENENTYGTGFELLKDSYTQMEEVDKELLSRFPGLRHSPPSKSSEQETYLLYRALIPPSYIGTRNLAYIGTATSIRNFFVAEIQALWICAFFGGQLDTAWQGVKNTGLARDEAVRRARFSRLRAPMGLGGTGTDMIFETVGYVDRLLMDLRLETRRKGWWRHLVEWYGVGDYKGVVGEWMDMGGLKKSREGFGTERSNGELGHL
jgi:hypothetical protein